MNAPPSCAEAVAIARTDLSIARERGAFDSAVTRKNTVNFQAMAFFDAIKEADTGSDDVKNISELREHEKCRDENATEERSDLKSSSSRISISPIIAISQMINGADNCADSFDFLAVVSAEYLETGRLMPKVLAQWAAAMMRGEKKRPVRNGRFANGTSVRNLYIWLAINTLVKREMVATRNDESPPTSACDAVAEALKQLGENPTAYASVKRIWNDFQRWRGP